MKRMFKQWMAGLLAAVLVLTLLPAAALADQPDGEAELPALETAEPAPEPEEAAPEVELTALEDVPMAIANFVGSGGTGSEGSPYEIATLDDLKAFAQYINEGNTGSGEYFKLTASIDMSSEYSEGTGTSWTPIGNETNRFQGPLTVATSR